MRRRLAIGAALVVLTCIAYHRAPTLQFINFDDPVYVTENRHVNAGLSWENVRWAMTSSYAANWIPLTWLSLMLDASAWGLRPSGYHLTNLAMHVAGVLVLFLMLEQLTGAAWRSAFVAALFGVHPLHVESVAWITERKDVLSTLFGLLSMWAYARYAVGSHWRWYVASLVLFVLGLMSKQMLVTMPALLFLLDFWPLQRWRSNNVQTPLPSREGPGEGLNVGMLQSTSDRPHPSSSTGRVAPKRLFVEKVPYLLVAAAATVIVVLVQRRGGTVQTFEQIPLGLRLANAVVVCVMYLMQMAWPAKLAVFYPYPRDGISFIQVASCAGVLAVITALVIVGRRRYRYLPVGWFWYLVTLIPVIGIVQVGSQRMADRYTYIPLIGIFIAIVWFLGDPMHGRYARRVALPAGAVVIALLTFITERQVRYWHDSRSLFERAVAVTENNAAAYTNLGLALSESGEHDKAIDRYEWALEIDPNHAIAHNNLGVELQQQGRGNAAFEHFQLAVEIDPNYAAARGNLAGALRLRNQPKEAETEYRAALRLEPENVTILVDFADFLRTANRRDEAMRQLEKAIAFDPKNGEAHMNLGMVYVETGRVELGLSHLRRAVELVDGSELARFNYGAALLATGRTDEAIEQFRAALRIRPKFPEAQAALDAALKAQKNGPSPKS